jgi:hypothetical protein
MTITVAAVQSMTARQAAESAKAVLFIMARLHCNGMPRSRQVVAGAERLHLPAEEVEDTLLGNWYAVTVFCHRIYAAHLTGLHEMI